MIIDSEHLKSLAEEAFYDYTHNIAAAVKRDYATGKGDGTTINISKDNDAYLIDIKKNDIPIALIDFRSDGTFCVKEYNPELTKSEIDSVLKAVSNGIETEISNEEYSNIVYQELYQEQMENTREDNQIEGLTYRDWDDGGCTSFYKGTEIAEYDPYEREINLKAPKAKDFWGSKDGEALMKNEELAGNFFSKYGIEEISRSYIKYMEKYQEKDKEKRA